jgi:hypothetical protein
MGRPSKLTDAQWERLKVNDWWAIAQGFVSSKDDEACLALLMRIHLIFGQARTLLGCAPIDRYRFEYPIDGYRADIALFHSDGGVSIVELKPENAVRDVVAGIGQLCWYETLIRRSVKASYFQKYLVAPVTDEALPLVDGACDMAGVSFIQYPSFSEVRKKRDVCRVKWAAQHGA